MEDKSKVFLSNIPNNSNQSLNYSSITMYDNISNIKFFLLKKGFQAHNIDLLFYFFHINSIEDALTLLSKNISGVWQHQRINIDSRTCIICDEDTLHISDYPPFIEFNNCSNNCSIYNKNITSFSKESDSILNVEKNGNKNNDKFLCCICYSEIISNLNLDIGCIHKFCINCYQSYIQTKISTQDIVELKCLEYTCKATFNDNDVRKIFFNNHKVYKKFLSIKQKKIKEKENLNQKAKHCPEINCDGWLKFETKNKFVTCEYGHKYCYNCLQKWHPNKKRCKSSTIDKDFLKYKKGKTIKRCPKCKYFTEKVYGCNHIICANCKYHWCWLCLKEYTDDHFEKGRCQGLQFSESKYIQNQCCFECYSIFCYLRYFYLFILITIIFSILGGPISLISIYLILFEDNSTFEDMDLGRWIMVANCGLTGIYLQPLCLLIGTSIILSVTLVAIIYPPFTKKFKHLFEEMF